MYMRSGLTHVNGAFGYVAMSIFGELQNSGGELACKRLGIASSGVATPRSLADEPAQARRRLRINFSTEITGKMIAPASALKSSDGRVRG